MRIYPDIHLKGGNINLERAKQLDPSVTELTLENAGELATKAGITVRVRCESEAKFTELLNTEGFSVERNSVKELAYVAKKNTDGSTTDNTQTGGGGIDTSGDMEG